jgi:hypothetical protein
LASHNEREAMAASRLVLTLARGGEVISLLASFELTVAHVHR